MTRPNITPGPWYLGKRSGADNGAIYGEKGEEIALPLGFFMEDSEAKANSKAIAAVPALLEALETASGAIEQLATAAGVNASAVQKHIRSALIAAGYQF